MLFIVNKYLAQNNYTHSLDEFKENYYSHPNYPSLFALTDTLSLLGIENIAVQVPKDQFEKLPDGFIADILVNNSKKIVLVNKQDQNVHYESEDGKKHHTSIDGFMDSWNGLVVAIEKNGKVVKKAGIHNNKEFYLFLTITSIVFLLSFFASDFGTPLLLFKIISFLGLLVSFFILQEKYEEGNGIVSRICNLNSNTSCDSVIKSDAGVIKWIGFSDLPILFFSSSFMAICLSGSYVPFIGLISLLAVPVIAFSIYLQAMKLKKWCILCLAVSTFILIQAIYFIFNFNVFNFSIEDLIGYTLITMVFTSIWYFFQNLLGERKNIIDKNKSLFRFKRNFNVFKFLVKEVNGAEKLHDLQPIKESPVDLSLFLSPSCGHCHTAYKEAMDLMTKFPTKIKIQIYYNLNSENSQNPFVQVAQTISQLNQFSNEAKRALDDWHVKQMNLEEWLEKWKQQEISYSINIILKEQYQWCQQNDFNFTPVKLINGQLFPSEYNVSELKYFLKDLLEEEIENHELQVR